MQYTDKLSEHYHSLLSGKYDCIDRITLNAYFPMLTMPGGVRCWYRELTGSDKGLDTHKLISFAGTFSKRVQSYCKSNNIPFHHYKSGERKHEDAEALIPADKSFTGIFAIFCCRASSRLWEVTTFGQGKIDIHKKKEYSLVNHYYIHIMDVEWGHICIRICAHPPFACLIMLNGHEWVERHKKTGELNVTKEGNCFTSYTDGKKLSKIADNLKKQGHLDKVCQRWVYQCLWFALDYEEQTRSRFKYKFSVYQVEYSRNLLFNTGRKLDNVYQNLITLTRERLDISRLKTIFGLKRGPYKCTNPSAPEVRIQTPEYNLTIFKIHFGKLTVKLYDKGERTLRAEVVVHNTKALGCKRGVEFFEEIITKLQELIKSFLDNMEYAHAALIDDGAVDKLTTPSVKGKNRQAGIDLCNKRNIAVVQVIMALSIKPRGFSVAEVVAQMKELHNKKYSIANARYDLRKMKSKKLIEKIKGKRNNKVTPVGLKTIASIICLWTDKLPSFLSLVNSTEEITQQKKELTEMEKCMFNTKSEFEHLINIYGIKRAA